MTTSNRLKVVIDTNIIFSALYNLRSNAGILLFHAIEGQIELFGSAYIRGELERNLKGRLGYTKEEFHETFNSLPINWIEDEGYLAKFEEAGKLIKNKKDVPILALALYLNCDIVSGDDHFLSIEPENFRCWKLKELIDFLDGEI